MDIRELSKLVSDEFSGNSVNIQLFSDNHIGSKKERYIASAALRLAKAYRMMRKGQASHYDFEAALRTYLIVTNSKIHIPNYSLTRDNHFGLNVDHQGDIYVNYQIPKYLVDKFVREAFLLNYKEPNTEPYKSLLANGYISSLTGFKNFKSNDQQLAVIGALKVPKGYTALVAMKTGGGKSLITQSVAYQYENSMTIVIVPTISLMLDQTRSARNIIKSGNAEKEIMCYYSGCDINTVTRAIDNHELRILFISPEALIKNQILRKKVIEAGMNGYLANMIVDEAHIIIEWGSSFREDFQCLDALRNVLLEANPNLRTYLLSATYSAETVRSLKMFYSVNDKWIELRFDHLRKEQRYNIVKCGSYTEKIAKLKELVCLLPHPMIVYVNTPSDAESIRDNLISTGYKNIRIFTGKTDSDERERLIQEWVNDDFDLMIATCAFGVGVDKKDVRTVIHVYIPSGPDQYYQECGRGGRDGLPCLGIMLYTNDDIQSAYKLSQKVLTTEKLLGRWFSVINSTKTKKGISRTVIDTSIKPTYNEDDEFFNYVSNADVSWNVYVILLLRKNGLLSIENIEYEYGRYLFYVKINDFRILYDTAETKQIFDEIREKEKALISDGFKAMKNALEFSDKRCLSDLFTGTYRLTEEYCSGCNAHSNVVNEENPDNIIMLPVKAPLSVPSGGISELMPGKNELLIFAQGNINECIEYLAKKKADVIVYNDPSDIKVINDLSENKTLLAINYGTFFNLCSRQNYFYLSGNVVLIMRNMEEDCKRILVSARKLPCKLVFVIEEDFFVSGSEKRLSEIVDGPSLPFNVLEKR